MSVLLHSMVGPVPSLCTDLFHSLPPPPLPSPSPKPLVEYPPLLNPSHMLRRLLPQSCAAAVAARSFVQGGPPPRKSTDAKGDMNQLYEVSRSHRAEMTDRQREKVEAQDRYYAQQVGKPAPLSENAFVNGKFGMRRRLHRTREDAIDLRSLSQAVDEGSNAMRK